MLQILSMGAIELEFDYAAALFIGVNTRLGFMLGILYIYYT